MIKWERFCREARDSMLSGCLDCSQEGQERDLSVSQVERWEGYRAGSMDLTWTVLESSKDFIQHGGGVRKLHEEEDLLVEGS